MKSRNPPSELRAALEKLRPSFMRAMAFSLVSSLLVLAPTGYMLEVYDRVVNSRNHLTLLMLTVAVVGAYALMEVLEWARSEILRAAGRAMDRQLCTRVFDAIFETNLRRTSGAGIQGMKDLRTLREFLSSPALIAMMEAPVSLVFLALIFFIHPFMGWAALIGAMLQVLVTWMTERSTQPPLTAANRASFAAQQYADSSLRNAEVIESMGLLPDIYKRWMLNQRKFITAQAHASDSGGGYQAVSRLLQQLMSSMLLGLGAFLALNEGINGGHAMILGGSILVGRVLAPLVQIVTQWRLVVGVRDAWVRLEELLGKVPPRQDNMSLPAPTGKVTVENLIAGAPGNAGPILRGVQFALQPGEVLAVVGPSASGKTTLARLLVGLWPAVSGKVRLDGADIFAWDKDELGPHLGYLPQDVELFDGTVADNIARFGEMDRGLVEAAARLVGVDDFISGLPQGYDTPIGVDGAVLSGGQRQRIALARALYGKPAFVVLDEPNSSLDEAGDAALVAALAALKQQGTTVVVMTHRTSILGVVDKMLVIRDGIQQLFGPRDDVLAALQKAAQSPAQNPAPVSRIAPVA